MVSRLLFLPAFSQTVEKRLEMRKRKGRHRRLFYFPVRPPARSFRSVPRLQIEHIEVAMQR